MISLVVHGGAWEIPDDAIATHREGVLKALKSGWAVLSAGGSAAQAVEKAVTVMEDDETFNAGRGSVINAAGEIELDASMMEGKSCRAGAVAALQRVAHPVSVARLIMEKSDNVLLVGMGAARFAQEHGIPFCSKDYLFTGSELARWRLAQAESRKGSSRKARGGRRRHDTVGAVALDRTGHIVAALSTGGTSNKHPGRVGDSPLIGCGLYADNAIGGVVASGWGEEIIRVVLAKSVIDCMERNGGNAEGACCAGIEMLRRKVHGYGGIIALNKKGEVGMAFNTPRMARAHMTIGMKSPVVAV
ncbi:MAG: Asparaginase [Bacteroidetes bacterium]|nr:Asparaginase [Bacteroidota bacterium]